MKRGKVTLTKEEAEELFHTIDNEGFGYYLTNYGPDINLLVKLGFDKEELTKLIQNLSQLENATYELEELME